MLLFLFAVLALVMFYYRDKIKLAANKLKPNGVIIDIDGMESFNTRYPTYCKNVSDHLTDFNKEYQNSYIYENIGPELVRKLFSKRDDVLYNISEIRLRLPNDLDMEKDITRIYESADRKMLEFITDVKTRFHTNITPGPVSSAFAARHYRAANDVVF